MCDKQDNLFNKLQVPLYPFSFDKKVASVFSNMARRSIPGYNNLLQLIGLIGKNFVLEQTNVYDLGCALGAASLAVYSQLKEINCCIIGIDHSSAMVNLCRKKIEDAKATHRIETVLADINYYPMKCASMVILNFTLQFIVPEKRQQLLEHIYQSLIPNGILILSEKITFIDPVKNSLLDTLHIDFKKTRGYSTLAINQKRASLENVMQLDTLMIHQTRLKKAGFVKNMIWFQNLNFISLLAIK